MTLVSVKVSPPSVTLPPGASEQLVATALFSNGSASDVTTGRATWSVDGSDLASVLNGRIVARKPGIAHVTATVGAVSGQATLTIPDLALTAVAISPDAPSTSVGGAVRLTATGKYEDGTTGDVTIGALWSVDDRSIAAVSTSYALSSAIVTGLSAGMTTVRATLGGTTPTAISATAALTITP